MIGLGPYVALGAVLFAIGAYGALTRHNPIAVLMCIEMMLNAANINFVAFSSFGGSIDGQIFVIFSLVVAACEAATGLALVLGVYRNRDIQEIGDMHLLKW
ncbi:MAG: NADH-quinone oxidoreductase subunit NuoK [Firmicutes bacterium]|nr:NADH-quinone oxidoreductase subunit NuoK [Bacillota bacterium]